MDRAAQAGITLEDLSGGPRKDALLETLGHGVAWFDYDGDGWVDLYLANGSSLDKIRGLDVTLTTSAGTDEEGRALLDAFKFPFRAN